MAVKSPGSGHVAATGEPRERLRAILRERAAAGGAVFPLSFNQSSLWYLHEYAPAASSYNVGFAARVRSELDVGALERALADLALRHPSLRTRFVAAHGRALQLHEPGVRQPLDVVDASSLSEDDLAAAVQRDYERPADLQHGPALRVSLYRRGEADAVLLLVVHHMLLDLWSLGILLADLGELYRARSTGDEADLPPAGGDLARFVRWQRALLAGPDGQAQLDHWRRELQGAEGALDLPADRPRPSLLSLEGDSVSFALDSDTTEAVTRLAREERTSTYAVLLACFQTLLIRYTGQDDVLVGSPVAGRTRPEFEDVVGHFVNMIVLRGRRDGDPTFREHLARVRETVLRALDNQDYPFAALVDQLGTARDPSRSPIFQVCFALQRASKLPALDAFMVAERPGRTLTFGGLELEPFPLSQQQGQFDLSLWMAEADGILTGELKYSTSLFDRSTAERMSRHFGSLVRAIVADPDRVLDDYPLLGDDEHALVVDEWNRTAAPYRADMCIHQLFEEQADRRPEAPAVAQAGEERTYAELEDAANRLANRLRALGVERGGLVGVHVDRTIDVPAALLGILKAGAGYVPLDTHYPAARIELILSSLPIRCVVTQTHLLAGLQDLDVPLVEHLVCVDGDDLAGASPQRPALVSRPDDVAYIIFTSGSTGTPKGVAVQHRPVINLIEWVNRTFEVGPGDRVLFVTSLSFDLSVYDVFGILAAGATVRVARRDELQDPDRLVRILREEPITFWDSAPPALAQLVPFLPAAAPQARLRLVFLSGDWIPLRLPDEVRRVFGQARVISLGGATEATIWSNWFDIGEVQPQWASIPYGKPISNARYYVLDRLRRPCPIGVPGDLYIGGECLASGYANDPDLTASKFVPDPYADAQGARMYLTGDRARYFPDGNIEFLGRTDFQVKIRGYRVELGEIEAAIADHPGVVECTVQARDDGGRDKYLAAYLVARDPQTRPSSTELRAYLKERLPDFMVPQHFMELDRIPVTPNGKLDRKALPVPEQRRDQLATQYAAPRDEVEERLATTWERFLAVDRVGIHDDFFDLGGHSLMAVQLVHEIEQQFGVRLAVSTLLLASTVADLARAVGGAGTGGGPGDLLVPLSDGDASEPLFCLHPSGGDVLAYRALAARLAEGRPIVGVRSRALGDPAQEATDIDEMARDYAAAIRRRQPTGPYHLLGWSMGGVLAHAVAAELEAESQEVAFVAMLDSGLPVENSAIRESIEYRLGTAIGSLAGLLDNDREAIGRILTLPESEQLAEAIKLVREAGAAPVGVSRAALERERALVRAHGELLAEHRPRPVSAPLLVWWAQESLLDGQPPMDWGKYATEAPMVRVVPDSRHYTILQEPHVGAVAAGIAAAGVHVRSTGSALDPE